MVAIIDNDDYVEVENNVMAMVNFARSGNLGKQKDRWIDR